MSDSSTSEVNAVIQATLDRAIVALVKKDIAAAIDGLFAPDAVFVIAGATLVGRDAIIRHFETAPALVRGLIASASVTVVGDIAYEIGTNAMTFAAADGTTTTVRGRYLSVWRKSKDHAWRIVADAPMRDP